MVAWKILLFDLFEAEKILTFRGRCSRKKCFVNVLLSNVLTISYLYLVRILVTDKLLIDLSIITLLPIGVFWCANIVRRLHDLEMTGWWILLLLSFEILFVLNLYDYQFMREDIFLSILLTKLILMTYICVAEGSKGFNKYGKDHLIVAHKA